MNWFLLASCSALLSASAAVAQKKVLYRLNAFEFSFLVSIAILVFSFFIPFTADITNLSTVSAVILIGKSIVGGLAFLLVMMSLEHNQISSALPLLGTTPAVTALLALPFPGEFIRGWEWLGIVLILAGTYLLEKKPARNLSRSFVDFFRSKNHYYIFGAVGLFAVSSIADKILLIGYRNDPLVVLFYQHIIYCLMFGVFIFSRRNTFTDLVQKGRSMLPLVLVIALLTIAYRFTQLWAIQLAPVALVLAIKRTSILYATFFGGKLFSDERLKQKLAGAALIVAAGFIILRNVA